MNVYNIPVLLFFTKEKARGWAIEKDIQLPKHYIRGDRRLSRVYADQPAEDA